MTFLEMIARAAEQYQRGYITVEEYARKLSDSFAGDMELHTNVAADIVATIPAAARKLVKDQVELALSQGYIRQPFAFGGSTRTKEQEHAAALRETAREQKWAEALRPLLS